VPTCLREVRGVVFLRHSVELCSSRRPVIVVCVLGKMSLTWHGEIGRVGRVRQGYYEETARVKFDRYGEVRSRDVTDAELISPRWKELRRWLDIQPDTSCGRVTIISLFARESAWSSS